MSYYGWKAVRFDFEKRWEEAHRQGRLHLFEKTRILAGDYRPVIRELEPGFREGEKHVLSRTRPRGALVFDRLTGTEIEYPKPPAEDLFWIEVRDVARHRIGYWRVRFHVHDRRQVVLRVRRKPPAFSRERGGESVVDDEQVVIDSAYTTNPRQALDHLQAVPREYQNVLDMRSKEKWANHRRGERLEETAREDAKRVAARLKALLIQAARAGIDPADILAPIERDLAAREEELREAA